MSEIFDIDYDDELFEKLKELRKELADWKPAYIVATDETLMLLSTIKPLTKEWFCNIDGLKEKRFNSYWKEILSLIRDHLQNTWANVEKLEEFEKESFQKLKQKELEREKAKHTIKQNIKITNKILPKNTIKNTYKFRSDNYPWYVIVKLEWFFWTVRWEDAEILHDILWFKVVDNKFWKFTWCPILENIIIALENWRYDYIVVQNQECIVEKTFDRFI